jgi:maleylpyruvate isomerase
MTYKLKLFHYWRSSASFRVRYGLEIKRISYEKAAIDLLKGEEKLAEYRKENPSGYVPTLIVNGSHALGESLSILEWLEEAFPQPSFFTGDSFLRARIRQLAETVNSGIQPLQNLDVNRKYSSDKSAQEEWTRHWIVRGLGVYEGLLENIGTGKKKFSVADHPTLADICLIPQCFSSLRFGVDLAQFPRCKEIYEHAISLSGDS